MVGYSLLVAAHVACGFGGLVALPVPLLARKGSPVHRRVGWVFVGAMVGAAVSGLAMSALWMGVPERIHPTPTGEDPVVHAAMLRIYGAFLGYLAILILSSAWGGIRALRREAPHVLDRVLPVALVLGGVGLSIEAVLQWSWLFLAFGAFGSVLGGRDLARSGQANRSRRELHGRSMIGTGMAAVTAFLALGARRWVDVPDVLAPVVWLGPLVVGVPLSAWMLRRDRARAGRSEGEDRVSAVG